jgi:hypothetical protein
LGGEKVKALGRGLCYGQKNEVEHGFYCVGLKLLTLTLGKAALGSNFLFNTRRARSRDSSVGIATGWAAWVRFPAVKDVSLLHTVHTGSGANPASEYNEYRGAIFPEVKRPGREADHSSPSTAEVKNGGLIPPLPHTPSWGCA